MIASSDRKASFSSGSSFFGEKNVYTGTPAASSASEIKTCCWVTCVINTIEKKIVKVGTSVVHIPLGEDHRCLLSKIRAETPVARYASDNRKTELFTKADSELTTLAMKAVKHRTANPM